MRQKGVLYEYNARSCALELIICTKGNLSLKYGGKRWLRTKRKKIKGRLAHLVTHIPKKSALCLGNNVIDLFLELRWESVCSVRITDFFFKKKKLALRSPPPPARQYFGHVQKCRFFFVQPPSLLPTLSPVYGIPERNMLRCAILEIRAADCFRTIQYFQMSIAPKREMNGCFG